MTDEIKERLQSSTDQCLKSYDAWCKNKKDNAASEALQEAVHELRKVSSRLEIELAVSERNEMSQKPIPIPAHRDGGGRHQNADDNKGNAKGKGNDAKGGKKPAPKKAAGGEN